MKLVNRMLIIKTVEGSKNLIAANDRPRNKYTLANVAQILDVSKEIVRLAVKALKNEGLISPIKKAAYFLTFSEVEIIKKYIEETKKNKKIRTRRK